MTVERYPDMWLIFRFQTEETAAAMATEFGGETYDARQHGKCTGWEKWRKKRRAATTAGAT